VRIAEKMWSGLLVCLLAVGATASKPGAPRQEEHEPCCAPRYFTFNQVTTTTSSVGHSLLVEYINAEGAYDAKFERVSVRVFLDYFNGTETHLRSIDDYLKGVSYLIIEHGEEEICFVGETEGRFDEECLDEEDKFLGEATLGDYDLLLDNWYDVGDDPNVHTIKSVQHEGCVPVYLLSRTVDPESGEELSVDSSSLFNFKLGICNPDKYFKPPAACDEGRALSEPTPEMLKYRRVGLARR